jgi:hypothetical protein
MDSVGNHPTSHSAFARTAKLVPQHTVAPHESSPGCRKVPAVYICKTRRDTK